RFVAAVSRGADFVGRVLDKAGLDGLIEGTQGLTRAAGAAIARSAQGRINDYLWWMLAGTALLLGRVLR
ncbi:MAG: hypothetical protein ABL955_04375, partial [Elusimicrobiota bacterium]